MGRRKQYLSIRQSNVQKNTSRSDISGQFQWIGREIVSSTLTFIIDQIEIEIGEIVGETDEDAGYQVFDIGEEDYRDDESLISSPSSDDESYDDIELISEEREKSFFLQWDEKLNRLVHRNTKWNPTGENNASAGTSKATYYRNIQNQRKLSEIAQAPNQTSISRYLTKGLAGTDTDVGFDTDDDMILASEHTPNNRKELSYSDAILAIKSEFDLESRSKIQDRKLARCNFGTWQRLQALSCLRYFEDLHTFPNKTQTEASTTVASIIYGKHKKNSYKAQQIRSWSNHFLQFRTFPTYSQGQHVKTATIIHDESVQLKFKYYLRNLADVDRSPQRFA